MKRNTILRVSAFCLKVLRALTLLGLCLSLVALVLYFTNPELLQHWQKSETSGNLEITYEVSIAGEEGSPTDLNQHTTASFLFNFFQITTTLLLLTFIFNRGLLILKSLKNWETFSQDNVQHFRKIGLYLLLIAPLVSLGFSQLGTASSLSFNFPLSWLCAALCAFVLAEIFKEGQRLAEEQKFTV